jgi:hypothetical protein
MYMRCLRRAAARKPASPCFSPNLARSYSIPKNSEIVKTCEPLRILFCGSDDFSNASLLALFKEYGKDRKFIQSLEVLCRPGKPVGRSLKTIQDGWKCASKLYVLVLTSYQSQSSLSHKSWGSRSMKETHLQTGR